MSNQNLHRLLYEHGLLFGACLMAYRKHHMGDDLVGWEELSDKLGTALQEVLGDKAFQDMLTRDGRIV